MNVNIMQIFRKISNSNSGKASLKCERIDCIIIHVRGIQNFLNANNQDEIKVFHERGKE